MVHRLRSHQVALLPVHRPQVRGWASRCLCLPSISWPRAQDQGLNGEAPGPSIPRVSPKPDAGGVKQDRLNPCCQGAPRSVGEGWMVCKKQSVDKKLSGVSVW